MISPMHHDVASRKAGFVGLRRVAVLWALLACDAEPAAERDRSEAPAHPSSSPGDGSTEHPQVPDHPDGGSSDGADASTGLPSDSIRDAGLEGPRAPGDAGLASGPGAVLDAGTPDDASSAQEPGADASASDALRAVRIEPLANPPNWPFLVQVKGVSLATLVSISVGGQELAPEALHFPATQPSATDVVFSFSMPQGSAAVPHMLRVAAQAGDGFLEVVNTGFEVLPEKPLEPAPYEPYVFPEDGSPVEEPPLVTFGRAPYVMSGSNMAIEQMWSVWISVDESEWPSCFDAILPNGYEGKLCCSMRIHGRETLEGHPEIENPMRGYINAAASYIEMEILRLGVWHKYVGSARNFGGTTGELVVLRHATNGRQLVLLGYGYDAYSCPMP